MKLRAILENIAKSEFFDFYALLDAYHQGHSNKPEIERHLSFVANEIYNDHMGQLGKIVLQRLIDPQHSEMAAVVGRYGLTFDKSGYQMLGLNNLTIVDKVNLTSEIIRFDHHHGFTGKTWQGLGKTFVELGHVRPGLNQMILAIDKIYNLLHHGGQITDYMDESDWLEDALNMRDNANPAQIFAQSSSQVRELIGRASYSGQNAKPVSDIAKIYTAIRRVSSRRDGIDVQNDGDSLTITVSLKETFLDNSQRPFAVIAWGGKLNQNMNARFDNRLTVGQEMLIGQIKISDINDNLIISGGGVEIAVSKPINRQFNLAHDLIDAAARIAAGGKLSKGPTIGSIKDSYFYKDKRRIRQ